MVKTLKHLLNSLNKPLLPLRRSFRRLFRSLLTSLNKSLKRALPSRKARLIFAGSLILIILPLIINGLLDLRSAKAAPWWQNTSGGGSWLKRQRLTVTNNSGDSLANGTTIAVSINTKLLATSYKLQSDCDDLRVLYQPNSTTFTELDRFVSYPGGGSCGTSEASKVYFKLQADLSNGSDSSYYYVYYGNSQATTPSNPDNAFDIGSKDALLVCPFDGTTTCAAGETPSTATGAIRYSGSKSALQFDGRQGGDMISLSSGPDVTSGSFTIEMWVNPQTDSYLNEGGSTTMNLIQTGAGARLIIQFNGGDTFGAFSIWVNGTQNFTSTNAFPSNTWTNMAVTFDTTDNKYRVYANGTLIITTATLVNPDASTSWSIGGPIGGGINHYRGLIDEVRISNVIRYTSNFTPSTAPFIRDEYTKLLYHLDENGDDPRQTGKAIDDACPDGTCNHGTITGAKYVGGLIGVDASTNDTGNSSNQSYSSHEGIFIEEATTNKITNPSFEHSTYSTAWTASSSASLSENTTAPYYKFGSKSTLLDSSITQYLNTNYSASQKLYATTSDKRLSQGFQVSTDSTVASVSPFIWRTGTASRYVRVEIQTDSSGVPSNTPIANGTSNCLDYASLATGYSNGYKNFTFSTPPSLTASVQYHLVLRSFTDASCATEQSSVDATNYVNWGYDNSSSTYSLGERATANEAGTWTPATAQDHMFAIYTGSSGSGLTSVNVGNTNTHTISAYVFNYVQGSNGATVDSTIAQLMYNATPVTTTYTDMGKGWWRLTASAAGINNSTTYGVEVKDQKRIFVDGVQLEAKAYATTYTDGSLTSNAGGNDTYFWDDDCDGTLDAGEDQTADQNAQCSSRLKSDVRYSSTNNITFSTGTISFWAKIHHVGTANKYFFEAACCTEPIRIYYASSGTVLYNWGATQGNGGSVASSVGKWVFFALTQNGTTTTLYQDTSSYSTGAGTLPTSGTIYMGDRSNQDFPSDVTLSDFRIYNDDLTVTEVTDLYYAGLVSHSDQYEVDAFDQSKGQDPLAIYHFDPSASSGQVAYDSSQYGNHLTVTGATFDTQSGNYPAQLTRTLKFDGTNDIASRSAGLSKNFNFGTDNFSISGWFRHPSTLTSQNTLISKYGSAGWKVYMNSSGYLCFGIDDDSSFDDDIICSNQNGNTTSYADSNWHHYEAVRDTSAIYLYIDGAKISEDLSLTSTLSLSSSSALFVGADSDNNEFWDGFLDEIVIYPYARSADQVKADILGSQLATSYGLLAADPLTEGLVGYWKMDDAGIDAEGETSTDYSGNGKSGTLYGDNGVGDNGTGMDCVSAGKFGTACNFDGTDDYVEATTVSANTGSELTMSAWVKPSNFSAIQTFFGYGLVNDWINLRVYTNSKIQVWDDINDNNIAINTTTTLTSGVWYYVTLVLQSDGTKQVFINGSLETTATGTTTVASDIATGTVGIGRRSFTTTPESFTGMVDEARIYNRALTPSEVEGLYRWAPGPVAYYKFDEGTGTSNVYDSSGNGLTGTMNGSMTESDWVPGKFGKALDFDGSDDYIEIGSSSKVDNSSAGTLEAWIKLDVISTEQSIFNFGGAAVANAGRFNFYIGSNNRLYIVQQTDGGTLYGVLSGTGTDFAANTWYYVSAVSDGSTYTLYINGVSVSLVATGGGNNGNWFSDTSVTETDRSVIGRRYYNGSWSIPFNGNVDDVKIYNYARTPAQIIEDMNASHPAPGSPVGSAVGHWRFDEGYGDTANNAGSGDTSLNGNLGGATSCPQSGDSACPSWTNSGKFSKALNFDTSGTTDDYVTIPEVSTFPSGGTISVWIKPATGYGQRIVTIDGVLVGTFDSDEMWMCADGNGCNFVVGADNMPPIGSWSNIIMTWDNSNLYYYLNGRFVISRPDSGFAEAGRGSYIGTGDTGSGPINHFNGIIDEVKIYNLALTADQVKTEFNQGAATVFGSLGTTSSNSPSFSSSDSYCPPGQGSTCTPPVAEWRFDEKTGTTAYDTSTNGNNAILGEDGAGSDVPVWRHSGVCKHGACLEFDGGDDDTSVTSGSAIENLFDTGGTVSVWIYPTSTLVDLDRLLFKGVIWELRFPSPSGSTANITFIKEFDGNDGTWSTTSQPITLNSWNHISITYNNDSSSNDPSFYVNGNLAASSEGSTPTGYRTSDVGSPLYVGNNNNGIRGFPGYIDELRFYNYARTPAQIAWDYNRGDPVAHWRFDECSGSDAKDSSGNSYDGIIYPGDSSGDNDTVGTCGSGTTTEMWNDGTSGKRNASLGFDGTNDYTRVTDNDVFDSLSQLTISSWIKPTSIGQQDRIIGKSDNGANKRQYHLELESDGNITGRVCGAGTGDCVDLTSTTTPITSGSWSHIVFTFNRSTGSKLYFNGIEIASTASVPSATTTASNDVDFRIGAAIDNGTTLFNFFDGQIDEVQIYNYALNATQIKTLYNDGVVKFGN